MNTFLFPRIYLSCFIFAIASHADMLEDASREADKIIRLQQQQLEQQHKDELANHPKTVIPTQIIEPKEKNVSATCRIIKQIQIENASLMDQKFKYTLIHKYQEKCMNIDDIEHLISDIVNYYISNGYISVRAYIQPQDLANGILKIVVVEGVVENIHIKNAPFYEYENLNISTAFPFIVGKPLNIRDIEQGLDQINRLQSNNATMSILPGTNSGESQVQIINNPALRLHFNASADNYGSTSTGEEQASFSLSLDNPLKLNDYLSYSHTRTINTDFIAQHSMMNAVSYSVPLGYSTLSFSHSRSNYATTIHAAGGDILSEGTTQNSSFSIDHVVYRNSTDRLSVSSSLSAKMNRNFIDKQYLEVSSRKLSTINLGSAWNTIFLGGSLSMNLEHIWGLKWFDALEDPSYLPKTAPHAQFRKWTYGINWMKPFELLEQNMVYSTALSGQQGDDVLYGSEQFSLGGLYSVRGYRNSSIAGDTGFYVRNDLSMPKTLSFKSQNFRIKPSMAFDFGEIKDRYDTKGGFVSGMSMGLNLGFSALTLDIALSKPLSMPKTMRDEGLLLFAKLNINL